MQEVDDKTVLGDFDDATLTQFGVTSRFFRKDGRFMVHTDGSSGKLHDYCHALVTFHRHAGQVAKALVYVRQLAKPFPQDPAVGKLLLEQQQGSK